MRTALVTGLATFATVLSAPADELAILSAAAVRPALIEVQPLYAKATGHRVLLSFGNATAIQNRVAAGEPVDLVILPPPQLDGLIARDLLARSSRHALGVVRLGIAARAGSARPALDTPEAFRQLLLSASSFGMPDPADGSTSSTYLVKLMQQLEIADVMRPKTRLFADGTLALQAVAKGEIALTVAPITSIYVVAGVELLGPLPEALQLKTVYAAALTTQSANSVAANALMKMLTSTEVATLMRQKGIDSP